MGVIEQDNCLKLTEPVPYQQAGLRSYSAFHLSEVHYLTRPRLAPSPMPWRGVYSINLQSAVIKNGQ